MPKDTQETPEDIEDQAERAAAMQKMTRNEFPVKILRTPHQLDRVREDLAECRASMQYGEKRTFTSLFLRRRLSVAGSIPLKDKIQALEMLEKKLSTEFIEGFLTPLKEAEVWEVRVHYAAILKALRGQLETLEGEAKAAVSDQIDQAMNTIWACKWVEFALKKSEKVNGVYVRYFSPGELVHLDPTLVNYLFIKYQDAFVLGEEELKKFAASTKAER